MNLFRILIPVFLTGVASIAGAAPPGPGFRPLPRDSVEQQTYLRSRALAVQLVREAQPKLGRADRRLAARVIHELEGARFLASTDRQSRQLCQARHYSLFVNAARPDVIHVCDVVRPHARQPDADAVFRLAQGFVHEAVHLAGDMDECAAMDFELAVMRRTIGIRSQGSEISYGAQCRRRAMGAR